MRADDDGFINNARKIQRMIGASNDDMKLLIAKSFVIPFESGVVVIRHWRIHNCIRKDRYTPTLYQDEMNMLECPDSHIYQVNKNYVGYSSAESLSPVGYGSTESLSPHGDRKNYDVSPTGYDSNESLSLRIDKNRLDKVRLDKISIEESEERKAEGGEAAMCDFKSAKSQKSKKEQKHKYGNFGHVLLTDTELEKWKEENPNDYEFWINELDEGIEMKGYKYKNHLLALRNWKKNGYSKLDKATASKDSCGSSKSSFDIDEWEELGMLPEIYGGET